MSRQSFPAAAVLAMLCLSACAGAPTPPAHAAGGNHWVATWGAAQLVPDAQNELPAPQWRDATLRQVVRASLPGSRVRVRLSNAFGTAPLVVDGAGIAIATAPGAAAVAPGSLRPLRFEGAASVTIPAGAEYLSDPVELAVGAGADLAISMYVTEAPARQTGHPGARATSFVAAGRHEMDVDLPHAATFTRWVQIAGVDVDAPDDAHAVVAIGDSITDGYGVVPDTYRRWTDGLAVRLRGAGMDRIGVVNAGIGGGRLLRDGLGPNLAARFERDVLGRAGVSHAIVMIGVNDFGVQHRNKEDTPEARARLLADMQESLRQIVARAHERGVCVVGATITPYANSGYYQPSAANEADRLAYNGWIRSSGAFDGVIDFDAALRDPARPDALRKDLDNDGLHPNAAGYQAMADAVPLGLLQSCRIGAR